MSISEISNQGFLTQSSKEKRNKELAKSLPPPADRVEVSSEARSLYETVGQKRLGEIRAKFQSNFYSRGDVTDKVADAILRELLK